MSLSQQYRKLQRQTTIKTHLDTIKWWPHTPGSTCPVRNLLNGWEIRVKLKSIVRSLTMFTMNVFLWMSRRNTLHIIKWLKETINALIITNEFQKCFISLTKHVAICFIKSMLCFIKLMLYSFFLSDYSIVEAI